MIRFLARHPSIHRIVHRLTVRGKPYALPNGSIQFPTCVIDRIVWSRLLADPTFVASIEQGKADLAAGRFTLFRGELVDDETGEPMFV